MTKLCYEVPEAVAYDMLCSHVCFWNPHWHADLSKEKLTHYNVNTFWVLSWQRVMNPPDAGGPARRLQPSASGTRPGHELIVPKAYLLLPESAVDYIKAAEQP